MFTSRWRRSGFAAKGRAASSSSRCRASVTADSGGSSCAVACLAASRAASGSAAFTRPETRAWRGTLLEADSMLSRSLGVRWRFQPGEAAAERRENVGVAVAHAHQVQQLVEWYGPFPLQGVGVGEVGLGHAHGVDDHEAVLVAGRRGSRR